MTNPRLPGTAARPLAQALGLVVAASVLLAGCGATSPRARAPAAQVTGGGAQFLATSLATPAATWAVVVMGRSAAAHNNFWQLFVRPAGSTGWRLVTPPGVPDNGGLVVAGENGQSVITAFRPSQYLTFTPLSHTTDGGRAWAALNPLDAVLANVPDALAAAPAGAQLLALLADGTVADAARGSARWHSLVTRRALGRTPAGRDCRLSGLTAIALTPDGRPIVAGGCGRRGAAGIFAAADGTWQEAGPALPAALTRQHVTVLRLTSSGKWTTALLAAGAAGADRKLVAAWADRSGHWAVSPPLRLRGAAVASASFGPGGVAAVLLSTGAAEVITRGGQPWAALRGLPAGTATLALGPAGTIQALAVHQAVLTVWQARLGGSSWSKVQAITVPIQYGSSG